LISQLLGQPSVAHVTSAFICPLSMRPNSWISLLPLNYAGDPDGSETA
jgi:hypothetical protein